ncbi:exopolysaccharide biosynthesis polyprenyl glycosylphosphotransferase [Mariprofundus ferrooxydans]|nr:exopolysaccharide biosynthesis polyprenyl glycosylphosphotransferase [Mariprofundus ferrooxydans]
MVEKYNIQRVYFALPMKTSHQVRDLQLQLIDLNVDIVWAPDIFGLHMISPSVRELAGVPLYYLSESPLVEGAQLSKMLLDKSLTLVALLLLFPFMLIIALAVKLTSPGPVLFKQERHGLNGKIIKVMKFRSMQVHDEADGVITQATRNDSRITSIGQFLRRSSLDELPQLFNVLKGDMSLVGPRPHARAHNDFYAGKIEAYMSRHRILPGMTGLAQVNGFRGETDTLEKMEKRVEYDLAYINNWSIWLDVRIMIKTVYTLLSKNAY